MTVEDILKDGQLHSRLVADEAWLVWNQPAQKWRVYGETGRAGRILYEGEDLEVALEVLKEGGGG